MLIRRLAVLAIAAPLALAAALVTLPAGPAAAQGVSAEEGTLYTAWLAADKAGDNAKAIASAKEYLAKYPTGQYAGYLKKWLAKAEASTAGTAFEAAVTEKRTDDMVKVGRQILSTEPDNLLVLYQMAFTIWSTDLIASPPRFDHLADAVEFATKAMPMVEAGKVPAGAQKFDKNLALAWMTQVLAINAAKAGKTDEAISLYQKSTAYAPGNVPLVVRNLYAILGFRQTAYSEAVKGFMAFPEADRQAPESKPDVKATLDKANAAADGLIDAAASFVANSKAKNVAAPVREKVNQTLEAVYKNRHPDDTGLAGLQKILQDKEAALAAPPPPPPPGD